MNVEYSDRGFERVSIENVRGTLNAYQSSIIGDYEDSFAITVHKSQGSEWPCVIVLLDPSAHSVCDRSWLYTAISRAKMRCILMGDKMTADRFCRKASVNQRKTFLAEQIARESARFNLAGI